METRQLMPSDWQTWKSFRLSALQESPTNFGSSYEEERDKSPEQWRGWIEKEVILGAFVNDTLVGSAGLRRLEEHRTRHRGVVFGVYVAPASRRAGIATLLLKKLFAYARATNIVQLQIGVDAANEAAAHFYEKIGFKTCGLMPRALIINATPHSIRHMFLCLDGYNESTT